MYTKPNSSTAPVWWPDMWSTGKEQSQHCNVFKRTNDNGRLAGTCCEVCNSDSVKDNTGLICNVGYVWMKEFVMYWSPHTNNIWLTVCRTMLTCWSWTCLVKRPRYSRYKHDTNPFRSSCCWYDFENKQRRGSSSSSTPMYTNRQVFHCTK